MAYSATEISQLIGAFAGSFDTVIGGAAAVAAVIAGVKVSIYAGRELLRVMRG